MKMSLAKAIALAATLGAAASANAAIQLKSNGQGQVLLYPLYSVDNGNDTAISVTNTTNEYKVVKVRFREALNSQDVLDFHLFLSPKDVWNGVVVAAENGGAKLITRDTSCTAPAIPADGAFLSDLAYGGRAVETALRGEDGGPQDLKRTRVGYAEVIELGVLDSTLPTSTPNVTFGQAIKHVNNVPGNCGAIISEYLTGEWSDGTGNYEFGFKTAAQVTTSTDGGLGGLYGVGTITNVFAGQQIGYDATAIDGFIDLSGTDANLHNATGYSFPDLNGNRTPGQAVTAPQAGLGTVQNAVINGVEYTFNSTIDAVSAVLQRAELNNEFSVENAVGGGTDWAITFPTKHYYLWDSQIAADGQRATFTAAGALGTSPSGDLVDDAPVNGEPVADFIGTTGAANVAPFQLVSLWKGVNGNAKAEVPVGLSYLNREEGQNTVNPEISFSPRPTIPNVGATLAYEANVLTFNNSNVLVAGDSYARYNFPVANAFTSGWATVRLSTNAANAVTSVAPVAPATGLAGTPIVGLPAIGFATIKVTNGDLNGVLSNYNAAWNHKSQ